MIDLGVDKGLIEKSGTWLSYGSERIGQGRENARIFLKENIAVRDKLEAALRKQLGLTSTAQTPAGNGAVPAEKSVAEKNAQAEKPGQATHAAAAAGASGMRPRPGR